MKKTISLLSVAVLAGIITLGSYKLLIEKDPAPQETTPVLPAPSYNTVAFNPTSAAANAGIDFTVAAEKTVNGVVHVKNLQISKQPRNMMEFLRGGAGGQKGYAGAGSGVIISPDGYVITNNHVIKGATELEITLNDNRSFEAELIGADALADIALLKINSNTDLPYITFGDSDTAKVGEWVLAVGNPFNLTSTVTAGIISAKARDIDETDRNAQSFIQTDAAINPGNSGGALVNTNGELVGINTAITSQTGSYVGYAFAVPSNNARKIVDDILEYGSVRKGILGVRGNSVSALRSEYKEEIGLTSTTGYYVGEVEINSGAEKAGIIQGDIIKMIDNIEINKFSDLSGYLNSKSPDDTVQVELWRDNKKLVVPVTLKLYESSTYKLEQLGFNVLNATKGDLKRQEAEQGVVINEITDPYIKRYYPEVLGGILSKIGEQEVQTVQDVERIMSAHSSREPLSIVVIVEGEQNKYSFRN